MVFRDDREALRHEIRELRETVSALEKERQAKKGELSNLVASIDAEVTKKTRVKRVVFLPIVMLALMLSLMVIIASSSGTDSRTIYGRVTSATGSTSVQAGDRCTAWLSEGGDNWDAKVSVLCNGTLLYDDGLMMCSNTGDFGHCTDSDFSANGGDPAIDLDRVNRRLQIREANPDWQVEIALDGVVPGGE